jgi:hypothetical protein
MNGVAFQEGSMKPAYNTFLAAGSNSPRGLAMRSSHRVQAAIIDLGNKQEAEQIVLFLSRRRRKDEVEIGRARGGGSAAGAMRNWDAGRGERIKEERD